MKCEMETLIPTINRLQEVFSATGSEDIQLPQIVAVGSQSCGKSSVLESLVGKSFLPRGTGIVTRCPIVLQMIHLSKDGNDPHNGIRERLGVEEWCQFLHTNKIFTDFDEVRREIEEETNRKAGSTKGICQAQICLKVFSPKVLDNLTVVDLPGLVRIPLPEQPQDIEKQVEDMVKEYITNENCIILAVSPAVNDIATSESLKLAKEVDPDGRRTVAVITKLDIMDPGTDAKDILSGKSIPVKLGIIGVVNRGQQDIDKSISEAMDKEAEFLARNYPTMSSNNGTPHLAKKLNELLLERIVTCLPPLVSKVNQLLLKTEKDLENLGKPLENKSEILVDTLVKFAEAYKASITGKSRNIETKQLAGGAKINYIFNDILPKELSRIDPLKDLTDTEILIAARNVLGIESRYNHFEEVYHHLVKVQILRLEAPVVHCAQLVDHEMKQIIQDSMKTLENEMLRFPKLKAAIEQVITELLDERQRKAKKMLKLVVDIQASFVATVSPEFKAQEQKAMEILKIPEVTEHILVGPNGVSSSAHSLNEKQTTFCGATREIIKSYFQIITANVLDFVPKALAQSVIYYTEDNVSQTLLNLLHKQENSEKLIAESEETADKRRKTNQTYAQLSSAKEILSDFNKH